MLGRLCWEQNVHVIVMLTREVEGAMVKCGNYWSESQFGSLHLKLLSRSGASPSQVRLSPFLLSFLVNQIMLMDVC